MRYGTGLVLVLAACLLATAASSAEPSASQARVLTFVYRSSTGAERKAHLVLPAWYGPERHPPIPFVVSPHGRGVDGAYNLRFWGDLPARGAFALVSPDGQGRRLPLYSWGYRGQIDDLARMPDLAEDAYSWLTVDRSRVFAIGDSMGGQEVLLLAARRGVALAGVAALDAVTDMAARYKRWFVTPGEHALPAKARVEFGGAPARVPGAYAERSPASSVGSIARSGIPLQLWWSHRDAVVTDQSVQSGAFAKRLRRIAPSAPVQEIVGYWQHAHEMHPETQLPAVLACFGLLPTAGVRVPAYVVTDGGAIRELPATSSRKPMPLSRAFCGRARR